MSQSSKQKLGSNERISAAPHPKGPLTTKLGRLVERASYFDLFVAATLVLFGAAIYYSTAPSGQALATNGVGVSPKFGDALYFSLVTFTTLGYGDYSPVGFGKIVAVCVVLWGLLLAALLIGKFASERQQATLLLLFTSDAQRRLETFSKQINDLRKEIADAASQSNPQSLRRTTKSLASLLEATFNYLIFNANQARLIEFGNNSALNSLYFELQRVQQICIFVHMQAIKDDVVSDRTFSIAIRLSGMMTIIRDMHHSFSTQESHTNMLIQWIRLNLFRNNETPVSKGEDTPAAVARKMCDAAGKLSNWTRSHQTAGLLQKIYDSIPAGEPQTWPSHIHKQLAQQLNVSNSLARRCIDSLIDCGRLPKQRKDRRIDSSVRAKLSER